jgi:lipoprotein-anchoring transpeptidase ErfK/SrfK
MNQFTKLPATANAGNQSQIPGAAGSGSNRSGQKRRGRNPKKRNYILPVILVIVGCVVFAFAAWSAVQSPVLASILSSSQTPVAELRPSFARVEIPKPVANNPQPEIVQVDAVLPTPTSLPTSEPTVESSVVNADPTQAPTIEPTAIPTNTELVPTVESLPQTTETPGVAYVEIVPDTPTSEYVAPTAAPYVPPVVAGTGGVHWLDVDLSNQRMYAYEGDTLVNSFIVSTGTWQTPTVTGSFKVWVKLRYSDMSGPGYYLPDVPYVMYFYKDYGIHGTYWHNNFGTPMSHGCVNLSIPDAEWVYNFSSVGTVVNVHY